MKKKKLVSSDQHMSGDQHRIVRRRGGRHVVRDAHDLGAASPILSLHRTNEKDASGKRARTFYVSDGVEVERMTEKKFVAYLPKLPQGTAIRVTSVHATDAVLLDLMQRGFQLQYAYWHDAGIEKGLPPEKVAIACARAACNFRPFRPRPDLANLRRVLALRNALVRCYGDALRAVKQEGRNAGILEDAELKSEPMFAKALEGLGAIRKAVVSEDGTMLDSAIGKIAAKIPECVLFNQIAHLDSWISSASICAYSGGFDRFERVSQLWKYFGQHVTDSSAPKRRKGVVSDWSTQGRTAVYLLGEAIIKHRANPWRDYFDEARAAELAAHAKKCGCDHPEGHSTARARRKMCKEILKRFFLAVKGKKIADHPLLESHRPDVGRGEKATGPAKPKLILPSRQKKSATTGGFKTKNLVSPQGGDHILGESPNHSVSAQSLPAIGALTTRRSVRARAASNGAVKPKCAVSLPLNSAASDLLKPTRGVRRKGRKGQISVETQGALASAPAQILKGA